MTSPLEEHTFTAPNGIHTLVIGPDRASTGVRHDGCDHLAEVEAELDVAYCAACRWQCRIGGAWFVDLLDQSREALAQLVADLTPPKVEEDDPAVQAGLAAAARLIGTFRSEPSGMAYIIGAIDAARAAAGWVPWWMEQWGVDCTDCGYSEPGARSQCRECMSGDHLIGMFVLKARA